MRPKWDLSQEVILTNICLSAFEGNNKLSQESKSQKEKDNCALVGVCLCKAGSASFCP